MNVAVDPVFGCWIWLGPLSAKGYGPHWTVWERQTGHRRPPGVQFDHICRRRACVNPAHGDLVTPGENQRRRSARGRLGIEHCPAGHRLAEATTRRTPEGGVICTLCIRNA